MSTTTGFAIKLERKAARPQRKRRAYFSFFRKGSTQLAMAEGRWLSRRAMASMP